MSALSSAVRLGNDCSSVARQIAMWRASSLPTLRRPWAKTGCLACLLMVEEGRRGHLAHHEAGEQDRHRVLLERLAVALPIAAAVVVQPADVAQGQRLELALRLPLGRGDRPQAADSPLAD